MNAFDNNDKEDEGEVDIDDNADNEEEESKFKRFLRKLTHTKKICVFSDHQCSFQDENCSPSLEIDAVGNENGGIHSKTQCLLSKKCSTMGKLVFRTTFVTFLTQFPPSRQSSLMHVRLQN